jgi:hypothetical protein
MGEKRVKRMEGMGYTQGREGREKGWVRGG